MSEHLLFLGQMEKDALITVTESQKEENTGCNLVRVDADIMMS